MIILPHFAFTLQARDQGHWRIYQPKRKDQRTLTFPRLVVIGGRPLAWKKKSKTNLKKIKFGSAGNRKF